MDKICKMLQLPWMGEMCITEMISYSRKHKADIQKLGKNYLAQKGLTLDEYLNSIEKSNFAFDELFLVLFACTFSIHVGIILAKEGFWCSTQWIPS